MDMKWCKVSVLLCGLSSGFCVLADPLVDVANALKGGETKFQFRYRFEHVDQDGFDKEANASTLKSRFSFTSAPLYSTQAVIEVDDVSRVGNDNFNSTVNGKTAYPVVADPEGTDINQAHLKFSRDNFSAAVGRQRIVHNDQRFVGGVAWRQNEQTFDGYRFMYQGEKFELDYAYTFNINRIFGPSGDNADLHGRFHLANSKFRLNPEHKFAVYFYGLDYDTASSNSSRTLGIDYKGKAGVLDWTLRYARQSDAGDNPTDYDADFYLAEIGMMFGRLKVSAGYEVLGSDSGQGFMTPLATLHKFQGFADKFLSTPDNGIQDTYVKLSTQAEGYNMVLSWHDFSADEGGGDYGSELNLVVSKKLHKHFNALLKYADYSADDYATDTSKFWLMGVMSF